jgi:hypothetical protein
MSEIATDFVERAWHLSEAPGGPSPTLPRVYAVEDHWVGLTDTGRCCMQSKLP